MPTALALLPAFIAFLAWSFGDFSIQRAIRRVGSIGALFFIGAFGFVVLLPFAWTSLPSVLLNRQILLLLGLTFIVTLAAALFEFRALGEGKLAVVEPVLSSELAITALVGILFLGEQVTRTQILLAGFVFLGIMLTVSRREPHHWWGFWKKRSILERGVLAGAFGAIAMSLANIYTGLSSQSTSAVTTIWFIHTSLAATCLIWMFVQHQLGSVMSRAKQHWRPVLAESILDNVAWVAYAAAVRTLPISITVAITESYIVLASLLGIVWNHERLQLHQFFGMGVALVAAIILAVISA